MVGFLIRVKGLCRVSFFLLDRVKLYVLSFVMSQENREMGYVLDSHEWGGGWGGRGVAGQHM